MCRLACVQVAGAGLPFALLFLLHQPFNPDVQQLEAHTAKITPSLCLDLSLITPAFSNPAPDIHTLWG